MSSACPFGPSGYLNALLMVRCRPGIAQPPALHGSEFLAVPEDHPPDSSQFGLEEACSWSGVARPAKFLTASAFGGQRSIQLSYGRSYFFIPTPPLRPRFKPFLRPLVSLGRQRYTFLRRA